MDSTDIEGFGIEFFVGEKEEAYQSVWKFERLEAWQLAHQFVLRVYALTGMFPAEEKYGVTNQLRRAAVSIPANIAEGTGKNSLKDVVRFFSIARGSLEECKYYLILSKDLKFIQPEEFNQMKEIADQTGKKLNALISSLEKKITNP